MIFDSFPVILLLSVTFMLIEANSKLESKIKKDNEIDKGYIYSFFKNYNITDLQEFNCTIKHYHGINLTKTKYLIVNWDDMMLIENKTSPQIYINIFYPENTTTNVINENKKISKWKLECGIDSCTFGLKFILDNKHYSDLMYYNKTIEPDYSLMIFFTMKNDRFSLKTISYGGHNYPLYFCPTKFWFTNESNIIFQPHKSIENIKNFYGIESKKILVPIFPQSLNSKFFVCGVIKQPTLTDIQVGYNIKQNNEKNMEILNYCGIYNNNQINFSFLFLDINYNYDGTRKVIKIKADNDAILFGEVYYIYSYYNNNGKINGSLVNEPLKPRCLVKREIINTKSKIIPNFLFYNKLELFKKDNINYYLIDQKVYNRRFIVKCLTKFEMYYSSNLDNYYSMAVELELKKEINNSNELIDTNSILFLKNNLDSYGQYTCNVLSVSKSFINSGTIIENVYFIPDDHSYFYLPTINSSELISDIPSCKKSYGNFSYLTNIHVSFLNTSEKDIFTGTDNNNKVQKSFFNSSRKDFNETSHIICTYKTIVDTIFETHQLFKNKNTLGKYPLIMEKVYVYDFVYCVLVSIFFIIILLIIFLIFIYFVRKLRKICFKYKKEYKSTESKKEIQMNENYHV
ncbi:Hypothetical protein SRAE_1000032300 [Strongyloides ratti]|uniref:Uncharacterized protein n=1 Tax=Strongyloides ratti TaxID=34506 RepID=A0A090L1P9_STRRB|nr:Hypothetical protein SRAE_1000032300 [Strongyloides ratti]CEF62047.1 Hypothetical protein SRAE_1000032300 [Strongyloides ratti]